MMAKASPYQAVFMTASSNEEADKIANALVGEGLAACVNMLPGCLSVYRWKGELVNDTEILMIAKTHRDRFDAIVERVTTLHSYDVPEIIAVDVTALADGYKGFLRDLLGE